MKLEKIKKTYNDYKLELSWGQVEAIAAALEANHADALGDELFAEWKWYMERVPGPGEDEDAWEAQQKSIEDQKNGGGDMGVPAPPGGQEGTPPAGAEEQATFMPDEEEGTPGAPEAGAEGGLEAPPEEGGQEEPIALQRLKGEAPPANAAPGGEGEAEIGLPEPEGEFPPAPEQEADRRLPRPPRE